MRGETCRLCGAETTVIAFEGPIRAGKPGQFTPHDEVVRSCERCGVGFLVRATEIDYQSDEYRDLVDGGGSVERYYSLHDAEQLPKLQAVGLDSLRGAIVMDVGCGAGSFLDLVKGFAKATLGVEPFEGYHAALIEKGHTVSAYCDRVGQAWQGRVDVATCFSVLEHVEDPIQLLREIRACLGPDGQLVLSTPNSRDWLLELLPREYGAFFFRRVHKWYFDARSIRHVSEAAGFAECEVWYEHRFDLSNLLVWLRDKTPSGRARVQVPGPIDEAFRRWLREEGRADYLYARLHG